MPNYGLIHQFNNFNFTDYNTDLDTSYYNLSFQAHFISNNGHPNIDNYAEIYAPGSVTKLISPRFTFVNNWLVIGLEPYLRTFSYGKNVRLVDGTYGFNNNHFNNVDNEKNDMGFRQSQITLHYKGIGFSYGRMSHWWSSGFHSGIALTSNAPSQETYSIGTIRDIRIGRFDFGSTVIVMPYLNRNSDQLYFSGFNTHITYHSDPIITLGLYRTFLSGDFSDLSSKTLSTHNWNLEDAARLVIEPLFGQSKTNISYTIPGTPGFDIWDEVLTGFVTLTFPDEKLEVYAELASDDNRGNFTDLLAHWDHTLGYLLGFKKFFSINKINFFTGVEYLTTRVSNTFKPQFYRGSEPDNFYAKSYYDFFTYQGRRMGAHSGSSSNDLILKIGANLEDKMIFASYNREMHGIKSKLYPELKTEINLTYYHTLSNFHSLFIMLEHEKIRNYGFLQDSLSISQFLWIGYVFSIQ